MIRFQCPTCLKKLQAPDGTTGRKTNCPSCGQRLLIPPPIRTQVQNKTILGQPTPSPPERLDESETGIGQPHQAEGEYSRLESRETEPAEQEADEKYCHECGAVIRAKAEICPSCGVRQPRQFSADSSLEPHRGTAILVLGILGLVFGLFGLPFGMIAWLWANKDLRKMDRGIMNPEGRGLTRAGRICGMINVGIVTILLMFLFCMCGIGMLLPR